MEKVMKKFIAAATIVLVSLAATSTAKAGSPFKGPSQPIKKFPQIGGGQKHGSGFGGFKQHNGFGGFKQHNGFGGFNQHNGFGGQKKFVTPYHLQHGKKFNHGYYFAGKGHNHWTHTTFSKQYGVNLHWCPSTSGYYFWHAKAACYYPISYYKYAFPN
jgi:hypothetical protein